MFNLIVTTYRNMESEAAAELNVLLGEAGDDKPEISYTGLAGLLTCSTCLEPLELVPKIRKMAADDPWKVRYVLRLIPVEVVVSTDINEIREAASKLAARIGEGQTFRVTVKKRRSGIHTKEIIDAVAGIIDRKVSLDSQDWVVLVEVIGDKTGVSVVKPESIFSSVKTKRGLE